jgi:hypothetical protein
VRFGLFGPAFASDNAGDGPPMMAELEATTVSPLAPSSLGTASTALTYTSTRATSPAPASTPASGAAGHP